MTDKPENAKRVVTLVENSYQPSKAELEERVAFPAGTTPDDLAKALMRPVEIRVTPRPE